MLSKPKPTMVMMKLMGQAGETPAEGKYIIGMADVLVKAAENMWTKRFLCVLQAVVPLIQWMCELSLHITADGIIDT